MKAALVVALLLLPTVAAADDAVTVEDIRAEEESRRGRWVGLARVRASYPLTLSGGIGAVRSELPESWECVATCPFRGWVYQVEPGLHGGQISAGYATMMAEKRHNKHFLADVFLGFGVKAVLMRTWGDSNLGPENRTFAGAEFSFSVTKANFSLGTMRRISGPADRDWIVTLGAGWGF